jgi:hypothetical protein
MLVAMLNNCCCSGSVTQVCSWLRLPYGFDVTIPSISGCQDDSAPSGSITIPPGVCDYFPGTHKIFRYDYVNRATSTSACDSAQTSLNCQYISVSNDTVEGKRGPLIANCSVSGTTTIYQRKWYEYHRCIAQDPETSLNYYPFEPYTEEHHDGSGVTAETRFIHTQTGGFSPGPSGIRVTITMYNRIYHVVDSGCVMKDGINSGWNAIYLTYFPSGTNVADEGTFTLDKTSGASNAPATIAMRANAMGLPGSGA